MLSLLVYVTIYSMPKILKVKMWVGDTKIVLCISACRGWRSTGQEEKCVIYENGVCATHKS